jgi:hypothetical protein
VVEDQTVQDVEAGAIIAAIGDFLLGYHTVRAQLLDPLARATIRGLSILCYLRRS